MKEFLVKGEPLAHFCLIFVAFVEPSDEDGGILAPLEYIFPHQADHPRDCVDIAFPTHNLNFRVLSG